MQFLIMLLGLGALFGFSRGEDDDNDTGGVTTPNPTPTPTPEPEPTPEPQPVIHSPLDDPDFAGLSESDFDNIVYGDSGNDIGADGLRGSRGDDLIVGNGGRDVLNGWAGDDYLWAMNSSGLTGINGQGGDDVIKGSVPGSGQIHIRAGDGDDRIILDLTNQSGFQGHHVYTGSGEDRIEFEEIDQINHHVLGRIDDFDPSRDVLVLEGEELDLNNLPDGVDVVEYLDQQWLRIEDKALYALEGARDGGMERHFSEWPDDVSALPVVDYVDPENHVPKTDIDFENAGLNEIDADSSHVMGTDGDDLITDTRHSQAHGQGAHDHSGNHSGHLLVDAGAHIMAGDGDDVVNAGKGDDTVMGGNGDDHLAGGLDEDVLMGDAGDDVLYGGTENDTLMGGDGDDRLHGGDDEDILDGGAGRDQMIGGQGADTFSFGEGDLVNWEELQGTDEEKLAELDVIEDFVIGEDQIAIDQDLGVTDIDDLGIERVSIDGNDMFSISIGDTGERFLVDTEEDEDGQSELGEDAFIF